jgi:hypothetical protein
MTPSEWLNSLCVSGILVPTTLKRQRVLHLQTPCQIHINENVSKALLDNYDPKCEKGGILAAYPEKRDGSTLLIVKEAIFLDNISRNPESSYLPTRCDLDMIFKRAFDEQYLPISFHTHPTAHENSVAELLSYIWQSDTSKQDQLESYDAVKVCDHPILFPRSLILVSGKSKNRMFIGFYGGLIAPIEFEKNKNEQMQKAMNIIVDSVSQWAKKGHNKWWLAGGGIVLAFLIIRHYKTAIPLILLLAAMAPMFLDVPYEKSRYYAQITGGQITIEIP